MKASALWVLGEIRLEVGINLALPFLQAKDDMVRTNALKCLVRIKPESLKPFLPTLRKDPSPQIRQLVATLSFKII
jgi:HEAT repeat protein